MSFLSSKEVKYMQQRTRLLNHIKNKIRGFAIVRKDKSLLMRILSIVLFFNKGFMTSYFTTMYPKIYVPSWFGKMEYRHRLKAEVEILAHEYVHLYDRKRLGWLFNLFYLSPQIFSLLAIGAIWNSWFLLALVFLLPLPSPGRAWLEFRGYRMTLAVKHWMHLSKKLENKENSYTFLENCDITWIVKQFTGSSYYFMFPCRSALEKKFKQAIEDIKNNNLEPELLEIKNKVFGELK